VLGCCSIGVTADCSRRLGACCKAEVDVPQQGHHVGKQDLIAGRDKPVRHNVHEKRKIHKKHGEHVSMTAGKVRQG